MILNDTVNKSGLFQDIDFLVDTNDSIYLPVDKLRNINLAQEEITGVIIACDGTWQWDDSNYTDLPIGKTNLVANQKDYSFADDHLVINAIEIQDLQGNWKRLEPIDKYPDFNRALYHKSITNIQNTSTTVTQDLLELQDGSQFLLQNGDTLLFSETTTITSGLEVSGTPLYYDKVGESIMLYPSPNYSLTNGLKAFYQRKAQSFTITDSNKAPGFAPHLHRYLSICASYDWAIAKSHPKMKFLLSEKNRYTKLIKDFYSIRIKDETKRIQPYYQNNR
jgi:hypothetical protein